MRTTTSLTLLSALLLPLSALAVFTGEANFEKDGVKFNFKELKTHSVVVEKSKPPSVEKWTWTINPLGKLALDKDIKSEDQCPDGTQICGISRTWHDDKPADFPTQVIPIAGDIDKFKQDPEFELLKKETEGKLKGLRLTLHGPEYGDPKLKQKAVVDFICDEEKTGLEEADKDGKGNSLTFVSYEQEKDSSVKTLKLEWKTKYACEGAADEKPVEKKGSWGFFTWFIVIVFLVVAAYLIFGSWLNYNKYGARGWDLLPHSDTLRDLPYLIKDFLRRVVGTFQGSGGRGGYSAV